MAENIADDYDMEYEDVKSMYILLMGLSDFRISPIVVLAVQSPQLGTVLNLSFCNIGDSQQNLII